MALVLVAGGAAYVAQVGGEHDALVDVRQRQVADVHVPHRQRLLRVGELLRAKRPTRGQHTILEFKVRITTAATTAVAG